MLKFRFLSYANFGPMAQWYEDMAKQGWQIEKIILPFIHQFKKCEPADIKYQFTIAPNETWYVKFSKEELKDYDEMAEEYGWHMVDRSFNMNLYQVDEKGSNSLYNDDFYEIEILNKGIKGELITISLNLLVFVFLALSSIARLRSSDIYYSNFPFFMAPAVSLFLILSLLSLGDYVSFKRRNSEVKAIKDLKFTGLGIGKLQAFLPVLSIVLIILSWIALVIHQLEMGYGLTILISVIPMIFMVILISYFIKKVKLMDAQKGQKKFLFALIPVIMFVVFSISNLGIFAKLALKDDLQTKEIAGFSVRKESTSFLAESCEDYMADSNDLNIRITVVNSEGLAEDLFNRILRNAKNHPYRAEFVKDISKDFSYDKVYSLSDENSYLILKGNMVLEVDGNIYDEKVTKDIEKILEAK
ncbi:DUF2812 domain-containing protein [Anaerococcus lactolyticus]|uniref:DUF2812 domain-containing protein n=1 Tax=Anaerococcus lactolyticus S7-1-13 TaxID=1284686 RepID=A0A095Y8T0_9FIRM|nr:DUF2812 domain-containing protein [Anaerococcus lactolyticus]KGF03047.1 hypothetical protein HMPREF1630_08630 [Anaerococcus lactolyticus S7-1-13]